jgi:hypothetical protein
MAMNIGTVGAKLKFYVSPKAVEAQAANAAAVKAQSGSATAGFDRIIT